MVSIIGTDEMRLRHMISKCNEKDNEIRLKKLRKVQTIQEFEDAIRSDRLVVINFYSKECIFSQRLKPELEQINTDYYDRLDLMTIDCDKQGKVFFHFDELNSNT